MTSCATRKWLTRLRTESARHDAQEIPPRESATRDISRPRYREILLENPRALWLWLLESILGEGSFHFGVSSLRIEGWCLTISGLVRLANARVALGETTVAWHETKGGRCSRGVHIYIGRLSHASYPRGPGDIRPPRDIAEFSMAVLIHEMIHCVLSSLGEDGASVTLDDLIDAKPHETHELNLW